MFLKLVNVVLSTTLIGSEFQTFIILLKKKYLDSYLKFFISMYGDHTVILCDSEEGVKQALCTYCDEWKLKLNRNNTKTVVFSRGMANFYQYKFEFRCKKIEVAEDYKHHGVLFNYNGRFRKRRVGTERRSNKGNVFSNW